MLLCENFAVKPLQTGEIMSNNKITQLSYFYWNTNEKKADEKAPLFPDETYRDCDIAWCFCKNASWNAIRLSSDLHRKSRCEMLTGGDNITTDVITFLARVFQCSFTFTLVSASRWVVEIWNLRRPGTTGESEVEFKPSSREVVASSLPFSRHVARAPRRASSQVRKGL